MSVTAIALPVSLAPAVATARPRVGIRAIARRAAVNLGIGCVVPAAVFYTLFALAGVWTAILATLAWSYGALGWRVLAGKRIPAVLVLTTGVLTARTGVALATDSPFIYFLQPVVTDAVIAFVFLASLRGRPIAGKLAADFYPVDDELAARPRVDRLFRGLTFAWAALCLVKSSFGMWLLLTHPLETFVPVKAAVILCLHAAAAASMIAAATYVARREGLISL